MEDLAILAVVELEDDAQILGSVEGSGGDRKMTEINAGTPPNVVSLASDVGQRPGIWFFFHGLHENVGQVGFYGGVKGSGHVGVQCLVDARYFHDFHLLVLEKGQIKQVGEHNSANGDIFVTDNGVVPVGSSAWLEAVALVIS